MAIATDGDNLVDLHKGQEYIAEVERRASHPFNVYKPSTSKDHHQLSFHRSKAWCRMLFGGNKSGKSMAAAYEIASWLTNANRWQETPKAPIRLWLLSAEYRTLYEGVWHHLRECLPDWQVKRYGASIPGWAMPSLIQMNNGSQLDLISAEGGESARQRLQAASIHLLIIDEEISPLLWEELMMRLIQFGGRVILAGTLVRSEPWILDLEQKAMSGDKDHNLTRLDTSKNPHLDQRTLEIVQSSLSDEEKEVRIKGRSRRTSGLIFGTFGSEQVVEPFEIPKEWPRFFVCDPGYRVFACLWAALAPNKRVYAYRELYIRRHSGLSDIVAAIKAIEEGQPEPEVRLIDPASYAHNQDGTEGIAITLATDYDLVCAPADNSVHAGIEKCRKWLEPLLDGKPGFQVFRDMENFRSEISRYRIRQDTRDRDQHSRADEPLRRDDHLMSCLRYLAMYSPQWYEEPTDVEKAAERLRRGEDSSSKAATSMADRMLVHAAEAALKEKHGEGNKWVGSEY